MRGDVGAVRRRGIIAGNWKMHKTAGEAAAYVRAFLPALAHMPDVYDVVLCPPFTAIDAAARGLREAAGDGRVTLGAQDMHWENAGAYTGEIAPGMLVELGVRYVIVGHSERRQFFGESDETVRRKTAAALAHGITPIVAVGETLEEREAGRAHDRVVAQTRAALEGLATAQISKTVFAYEPIWAIGTGRNCDPVQANEAMHAIRTAVAGLEDAPILYGGSAKPENIAEYTTQPQIDGGLIGGASLDPQNFASLVRAACAGAA